MSPSGRFAGRTAIVTGSSRGIGLAIAARLAREGARVVLNARDDEALRAAADTLAGSGAEVACVAGSASGEDTPSRLVARAVEAFGGVDVVVNNVAISPYYGPLAAADRERFVRTMAVNTWSPLALVQEALDHGLGRDGAGAVLNVTTAGADMVVPRIGAYIASKAAVESLTRTLARELGAYGVRVNAVAPGLVRTQMSEVLWTQGQAADEAAILPLGRLGAPEDVAAAAAFLLSDEASWITGAVLAVDGGRHVIGDEPKALFGRFDQPRPGLARAGRDQC